ncbi:MAG: hypothetical protein Q8J89_14020 [Caulobacter sp.]|nr:hypothetical protein [Caulobacter sp.]
MKVARSASGLLAVLALAAPLGGCVTYSATGADGAPGARHVFGLVVIVLDDRDPADRPALTTSTSLGLGLRLGGSDPGVAVGYNRDARLTLPPNSCVDIDRPGPCGAEPLEEDKP